MDEIEKQTCNNLQSHLLPRFKTLIDLMENLKEIIKEADNSINQNYKENPYCSTIGLVALAKDVEVKNQANQDGNH